MIDASQIYTAQRAQNIMTEEDIKRVYQLVADDTNVIDYSQLVGMDELKENDYTLDLKRYIERTPIPIKDPALVREEYFAAVKHVQEAEARMKELLQAGGYIHE